MRIILFIMFYTIMYIRRSLEKEINIVKDRTIRMAVSTHDIYTKLSLKDSEFEFLLKSETTLNNVDIKMRIILFNIRYVNNMLANSLEEKRLVFIRLRFQVISYDLLTTDGLIVYYDELNATDDNLYVNSNGNFNYVYLQIDIARYTYYNLRLCKPFDFADVTYKIKKTNRQQCNRGKDNSENNENSNMPVQFRLGRNLKSVIMPRDLKQRLECLQTDDSLQTYHYADSQKRNEFSDQPNFEKGKSEFFLSRTLRLSEQTRPALFNKRNMKKKYMSSRQKSNLRRSNGIQTTNDSDVEKEATVYEDTIQLLGNSITTREYDFSDIDNKSNLPDGVQTSFNKVEDNITLSSLDIYKYESSTVDYNYYVDYNLKADKDDTEYEDDYEEPMEYTLHWYDYFEDNVTFTTILSQIDTDALHTHATLSFVTPTNLISMTETVLFDVETTTDSILSVTLLEFNETLKATTALIDDTFSLMAIKTEKDKAFTQIDGTTTESYISEINNKTIRIITARTTLSTTLKPMSIEASPSLTVTEMTTVSGSTIELLLFEETVTAISYDIIGTTTLYSQIFEKSTIIEPLLDYILSITENVSDIKFITEIKRIGINKSEETITNSTLKPTEIIITTSYTTMTQEDIIETGVSPFTISKGTSIITSAIIEDESEKTTSEVFSSSSLKGMTLSITRERTESVKPGKTHPVFTITTQMSQAEETTGMYVPETIYTTTIITSETIKVEESTRIGVEESSFSTFATLIPEIIETEESIEVTTSESNYVGFTISSKMSLIEEDTTTSMPEIIYITVTATSDITEKEEDISTISIEQFLITFTTIPTISFLEVLKTSITDVVTPISSEILSTIGEWKLITTNGMVLSLSTITMNKTEKVTILIEMNDKLISASTETSLTETNASHHSITASVPSLLEVYTFTMVAELSTTNDDGIDIDSSSIFTETTTLSSEITFISSISSYSDSYSHTIVFPETFYASEKETYFLATTSETFVTYDTDSIISHTLEKTLQSFSFTVTTGTITLIEEMSQPKSTIIPLILTELSLSVGSTSVKSLQEIHKPTLISSTYFKTEAEKIRVLTETTVGVETIQKFVTSVSFEADVAVLSTSEELSLFSSIFIYSITPIDEKEGTHTLRRTTSEIAPHSISSIFFISETVTSPTFEITVFVSNFTDFYYPKETSFITRALYTGAPILSTSPSRNISLTFSSEVEYPSISVLFLPMATVLTTEIFQSYTPNTLIDKQTSVVFLDSSETRTTDKTTKPIEIEDYEEPEKFYDIEYGEDFREAYETDEYTDINETVPKWYDYEEEEITSDRKTTSKISKITVKKSISIFPTTPFVKDATTMTFLSEKSPEVSFEIETTSTEIFTIVSLISEPSKITYDTSDSSLVKAYRTSCDMEETTAVTAEYEMSTVSLTIISETVKEFKTLTIDIPSASTFDTTKEWYTSMSSKTFIYTTDDFEWWTNTSSCKTSEYTSATFELYDETTMMYSTRQTFFTSPDEMSPNISMELTEQYTKLKLNATENGSTIYVKETTTTPLLVFTDSWSVKETSKADTVLETEAFFDSTMTDASADLERTTTSEKYISRKVEEEITSIIPDEERSSLVEEAETAEFASHSATFFDLTPSLVTSILDRTSEEVEQEQKFKTLMDEIKRLEDREKEIKEEEEKLRITEVDFEQRQKLKEIEKEGKKDNTSFVDIIRSSYGATTVSESIELLSIDDLFTVCTFVTLRSTSNSTESIISDSSLRGEVLQQEMERLKEELKRKEDKLKEWERQLQERIEKFENEREEYEEKLRKKFVKTTEQGINLLTVTTTKSRLTSSFSTPADYANTTDKLCSLIMIYSSKAVSSSTFKPPVESELFTPAPPTERTTSTSRYLHRFEVTSKECGKKRDKDLSESKN